MSAVTKAALEAAMYAHISDEEEAPQLITGWVISAATSSFGDDGDQNVHSYWFESADNQAPHITHGLITMVDEWASSNGIYRDDDDE
jgi:hypothetical protein